MPIYAHRCKQPPPIEEHHVAWWACGECLPNFVPRCSMCDAPSPVKKTRGVFTGYEYGYLCPRCVAKVQAAGPWRERRAQAVAARRDALLERYPALYVVKATRAVTQLEGRLEGRGVQVRLRTTTRQWSQDRYVFHVAWDASRQTPAPAELGVPESILRSLADGSPRVIPEGASAWLRVAFEHLGKLDVLTVLTALLERASASASAVSSPSAPPR